MPTIAETKPAAYTVPADDLLAIRQCHDERGFVVARGVLEATEVDRLRQAVLRAGRAAGYDGSADRTLHALVETCPDLLRLIDNQRFLRIQELFAGSRDMTVGRSAGILRRPGSDGMGWHTDYSFPLGEVSRVDDVLNVTEQPAGTWFYLTGCAPERGGLAVIDRSHRMDWVGPDGFEFSAGHRSFAPRGGWDGHDRMDVPGMVGVIAEPGDQIIFAARTYHAAFPNGPELRLSCALGFRPGRRALRTGWDQPEQSQVFLANAPERFAPYLEHYLGYDATKPLMR